jgi:hypothetical protein
MALTGQPITLTGQPIMLTGQLITLQIALVQGAMLQIALVQGAMLQIALVQGAILQIALVQGVILVHGTTLVHGVTLVHGITLAEQSSDEPPLPPQLIRAPGTATTAPATAIRFIAWRLVMRSLLSSGVSSLFSLSSLFSQLIKISPSLGCTPFNLLQLI